jgi:dUTP pyrophosphatase
MEQQILWNVFDASKAYVDLVPPQTSGSAGYDLFISEKAVIAPNEIKRLHTNVCIQIPEGYVGYICPRSSSLMKGFDVQLGVIDSDYRGELMIQIRNVSNEPICVKFGDRIAQLTINKNIVPLLVKGSLTKTARGINGFGSTGASVDEKQMMEQFKLKEGNENKIVQCDYVSKVKEWCDANGYDDVSYIFDKVGSKYYCKTNFCGLIIGSGFATITKKECKQLCAEQVYHILKNTKTDPAKCFKWLNNCENKNEVY